jgi:hypothetical protein
VQHITLKPEVVDPEDVEMLQDLITAAVNEAIEKAHALMGETDGGCHGWFGRHGNPRPVTMSNAAVPSSVTLLVETFAELPGIGPKTASRLAFYLLRGKSELALRLATALQSLVEHTHAFAPSAITLRKEIPAPFAPTAP